MFVDNYLVMQHREAQEFADNAEQGEDISDWEIRRYRAVV